MDKGKKSCPFLYLFVLLTSVPSRPKKGSANRARQCKQYYGTKKLDTFDNIYETDKVKKFYV